MKEFFLAGLLSYLIPTGRAPNHVSPVEPMVASQPKVISTSGPHDFSGHIYSLGIIPPVVKEYGIPALHVKADRASVQNFAWRGSMEALHVGSRPFNGRDMRKPHAPIMVKLDRLFCDDIGEDGVSIQPRAQVKITNSQFVGNYGLRRGEGNNPGLDKIVQIDGADVIIEDCDFFHGLSPIRAKANSTVLVRRCRFIRCATCVSGDGVDNPKGRIPYDNGTAGPCHVIVEDCECWDCKEVARAFTGCTIELRNIKLHRTWRLQRLSGGTVIVR